MRTIAFATSIAHSHDLVARFRAAGVRAEHVDGDTPPTERRRILADLADGSVSVVSNVGVFGEGFDMPSIECVIDARPTQSLSLHIQHLGRGMRWAPGKTHVRIHDHAGNLLLHGLPDADRDYSLTLDRPKTKANPEFLRTCSQCSCMYPAGSAGCPECGEPNPKVDREVREIVEAEQIDIAALTGRRHCLVDGCDRPIKSKMLCLAHYRRARRGTPMTGPIRAVPPPAPDLCTRPGCGRPHKAHGLCMSHYRRKREGTDLDLPLRPYEIGRICSVRDCEKRSDWGGLCRRHADLRRRGKSMAEPQRPKAPKPEQCIEPGCEIRRNDIECRGYCHRHYEAHRRRGEFSVGPTGQPPVPIVIQEPKRTTGPKRCSRCWRPPMRRGLCRFHLEDAARGSA